MVLSETKDRTGALAHEYSRGFQDHRATGASSTVEESESVSSVGADTTVRSTAAAANDASQAAAADDDDASQEQEDDLASTASLPPNPRPNEAYCPSRPGAYAILGPGIGLPSLDEPSFGQISLGPDAIRNNDHDHEPRLRRRRRSDNSNDVLVEEDDVIFEGYLPGPTSEEILRRKAQNMLDSAITLDEEAVRTMDDDDNENDNKSAPQPQPLMQRNDINTSSQARAQGGNRSGEVVDEGGGSVKRRRLTLPHIVLLVALLLLAAVAMGVSLGGRSSSNDDTSASLMDSPPPPPANDGVDGGNKDVDVTTTLSEESDASTTPKYDGVNSDGDKSSYMSCIDIDENIRDRYDHAKLIISQMNNITSLETLDNITSPQRKALEWIVCQDKISSELIDNNNKDRSTGILPEQAHGTTSFGQQDSGEAQLLRRYALATFFFVTSERGPWNEMWNFLSEEEHECAWHQNKTRYNWPYGDFDPAGFVCTNVFGEGSIILLNDGDGDGGMQIRKMELNFRTPNNLTGILPSELGHLEGLTHIKLENQKGLIGPIPSTIGNLENLNSISILFGGPDFGGTIPSSLFTIPSLEWISLIFNEGTWEFPPSVKSTGNSLLGIRMDSTGLSGTVPSFISEFTILKELDFTGNNLEGAIPDSFGSLTALEYLNMYNNNLNGSLPQTFVKLTNLTAISLGKNNFQGSLPSLLGNLHKLRLLDLSYNNFEGGIPSTFSQLSSLEHVSLQHNYNLNGSISAFEPLQRLSSLLLYENGFSSTIPEGLFFNFTGRIFADFGHNKFTGRLPITFSERASNTSYLSVMQNNFDVAAVIDVICEEVPVLFAGCSSCPCCKSCCSDDSTYKKDLYCNFDLDFPKLAGLECGAWWFACHDSHYDPLPLD